MFVDAVSDVAGAVAKLGVEDPAVLSDSELLAAGESLTTVLRSVSAIRARVVGAIDTRGSADIERGQPTAGWLADSTGEARRSAREAVRLARGCRRLPLVSEAWADGRLSSDHVSELARAVANPRVSDQIVGLQELLIDRAQQTSFEIWRRELRTLVETLDADGGFRPEEDVPSVLRLLELFDGTVQLRGDLNVADRAVVEAALNAEADHLFRVHAREREESSDELQIPSRSQLLAEALVSLCRKGSAAAPDATVPLRPEAIIVIHDTDPDHAMVNNSPASVPLGQLGGLLTDAQWRRIVVDAQGEVLDLGRARRLASRAQRRALEVRDGGCVFPGCDAHVNWCEVHHVTPWEDGGTTDLAGMVLLCRRHHGVTHRKGWVTHMADGHLTWITPGGRTLVAQRHGETRGSPPPG
jgi:hypothetical protein